MKKSQKIYNCLSCNKDFVGYIYQNRKTCSKICAAKYTKNGYKSGENHVNYKHGLSYTKKYKHEYKQEYSLLNKERISELNKIWYQDNRESVLLKRKKYLKNNKSKVFALQKKYKKTRRSLNDQHTTQEWEILKEYYNAMCLCCKRIEPEITLVADHVIPISKGGSNYITNIQPLCVNCNMRKYSSYTDFRKFVPKKKNE